MGTMTRNHPKRQSRACLAMARTLRRLHRAGLSWPQIAREYPILSRSGNPSPGLAYLIAGGYEPRTQEVRDRLGLPTPRRSNNRLFRQPITEMPGPILYYALTHREEMP